MSYLCRLYELYELCKSYLLFYETLKITCFSFFFLNIQGWKTKTIKTKILKKYEKVPISLNSNNNFLELEKKFIVLEDRDLKDRVVKRKKEIK